MDWLTEKTDVPKIEEQYETGRSDSHSFYIVSAYTSKKDMHKIYLIG